MSNSVNKTRGSFVKPHNFRTYHRMQQTANTLEWLVMKFLKFCMYALQILIIDQVWGKATYRKRAPYLRYVYKPVMVPQYHYVPRVYVVHK